MLDLKKEARLRAQNTEPMRARLWSQLQIKLSRAANSPKCKCVNLSYNFGKIGAQISGPQQVNSI